MQNMQSLEYPWPDPPEFGRAIVIATGILWIRLPLPMALDHVNIYALDDGDAWTIIDTGMGSNKTRGLWRDLMTRELGGRPIRRVILTHHHPDHVGLAGWFKSEFGAEIWATRTAWLMARMLTLDVQELPTSETLEFWRTAGMDPVELEKRAAGKPFNFADSVHPIPLGFHRIKEGDQIVMGGRTWDIRIGNGHAPEHATFWSQEDDIVISGDQIISAISPNLGVYATEPEADPVGEWLEACERLSKHSKPTHLVLAGHKLPFLGLPHRMQQLIENHHHALDRLIEFIATPKSATECFPALFKRKIGEGEYGLALVEAVAHLNHLYLAGRAERILDAHGAFRYRAI